MRRILVGLCIVLGLAALVGAGGYFVLRRPDIPLETLERNYAATASQFIDLPSGVGMHYRDEGVQTRPTLLLIHGFSASLHTWEPWVRELGDRYRLVSLDLPGHGLTSAPAGYRASIPAFVNEVSAFARARGLEHFTIIGNSMGGHVAWEYALAHPNQVDALVLVDASGWPETRDGLDRDPPIFRLLRNPVLGPAMRDLDNTRLIRQGLEHAYADPRFVTDQLVDRYVQMSRAPGHRDILLQMTLNFRERRAASTEVLSALRMPTLILHGERDNLVPVEHGRQFAAAIPGSELIIWPDDGHMPQEEHPARSAEALSQFLVRVHAAQAIGSPLESGARANVTQGQ